MAVLAQGSSGQFTDALHAGNSNLALQVVGAVVREWDPYSLLASGCPKDEFDSEIASVVAEIPRIKSGQDATLALSRVFSSAFEPERFTPDECAALGHKLFAVLSANGLVG
jgi:hypothetical protein